MSTSTGDQKPQIPLSSFNFASESWAKGRKNKRANLISSGVAAIAVGITGLIGMSMSSGLSSLEDRQAEAATQISAANSRISELTGGVPNLDQHLRMREESIFGALGTDIDTGTIVTELLAAAPADIAVNSVSVTPASAAASADAGDTADVGPTVKVLVTAVSKESDAGLRWRAELRLNEMFNVTPPDVTQTGTSVTAILSVSTDKVQSELDAAKQVLDNAGVQASASDDEEVLDLTLETTTEES